MENQNKDVSRRNFLKLAAIASAGGAMMATAGCSSKSSDAAGSIPSGEEINFTKEADVVIIGSGLAGLFAAYATSKAGLKTIVVEKAATYGGDSMLAAGVMPVHGTQAMANQGMEDKSIDEWWTEKGEAYYADDPLPEYQKALFLDQTRCIDILTTEMGVEWAQFQEGYTYYFHIPAGGLANMFDVMTPLYNNVTNAGVETIFDSKAENFILNAEDEVVGLRVKDQVTGEYIDISGKRFLLSTGDFISNQALVAKYLPDWVTLACASNTSMGEGLTLAQSLGGDLLNMDTYGPLNSDNGQIVVWGWYGPIVDVTPAGKRFVNEQAGHEVSIDLHNAGFYNWYSIFDNQLANGPLSMSVEAVGKLGRIVTADTIEDLAAQINIRTDALVETINNYNTMMEAGEDTEFGRTLNLTPLSAPYYAALTFPVRYKTSGGVRIDTNAQLVDSAGNPIANIFAAGSCCGSVSPNLAVVAASGLYAGEKIAESLA